MSKNIKKIKTILLLSALDILPYETLDSLLIKNACINACINENYAQLIFPNGLYQLFEEFRNYIDNKLSQKISTNIDQHYGITKKIHNTIMLRFDILNNYKLAYAKMMIYFMLPWNYSKSLKFNWPTLDKIWYEAGNDKSTDFNYYSKRLLLNAAYSSATKFWLKDKSINNIDTDIYLNNKLNLIVDKGKKITRFSSYLSKMLG